MSDEYFTRAQIEAFNVVDSRLNHADSLFEASNRAIEHALYALRHLRLRDAYRYHNSAIRLRQASRTEVERAIAAAREGFDRTDKHCHIAYRKTRILQSPSRRLRAQMCTLFYAGAATIAVVAVLFLTYSLRIDLF